MRSPQLISPTQAQMVPSGVIQGAPATLVGSVGANGPPMQRNISTSQFFSNGLAFFITIFPDVYDLYAIDQTLKLYEINFIVELQAGTGSIQQQHMRMVSSAPYYGHEPNIAANGL